MSQATHEDEGSSIIIRIVLYTTSDFSVMNSKEVVEKVALWTFDGLLRIYRHVVFLVWYKY